MTDRMLDRDKLITILTYHFDSYLPSHHTPELAAARAADAILASGKTTKDEAQSPGDPVGWWVYPADRAVNTATMTETDLWIVKAVGGNLALIASLDPRESRKVLRTIERAALARVVRNQGQYSILREVHP